MTTHNNASEASMSHFGPLPTSKPRKAPSKQAMTRIRNAFDPAALKRICESDDFGQYAERVELDPHERTGRERFYHFQDNGSNILAVAHLDHVQNDGTCHVVETGAGWVALSGALDDRLGAYVILELLPRLGITCDWLLTTDEELGASTAEDFPFDRKGNFVTEKEYNWIIEFDRGGTDVVMYDFETPELVDLVEASGATVGVGSFSDICCLEHLGCVGINWGVGYQDYHGPRSHAWLEDTFRMVARFMKFHQANAKTWLPHEPAQPVNRGQWWEFADDDEALNEWLRSRHDDDEVCDDYYTEGT